MTEYKLYIGGLCYGVLYKQDGHITHRRLDLSTGTLLPERTLGEEDEAWYAGYMFYAPGPLLRGMEELSRSLAGEPDTLTVGEALYQRKDESMYIRRGQARSCSLYVKEGRCIGYHISSASTVAVLVEAGREDDTVLARWRAAGLTDQPRGIHRETRRIKMRDSVHLAADILLPAGETRALPTLLVRTPYGRAASLGVYERYAQRGYAVVVQDVRGREDSEGEWAPLVNEGEDGADTLDWIAAQPFSDGKVGMHGGSYLGYVQWAAAAGGSPHLRCLVSMVCAGSPFADFARAGGTLSSGILMWLFSMSRRKVDFALGERDDWTELLKTRPITDIPFRGLGHEIPCLNDWMAHLSNDKYWQRADCYRAPPNPNVPALIIGGWFDDDGMGTSQALDITPNYPDGMRKVVLGPWPHALNASYDLPEIPLAPNALLPDLDLLCLQWLDHHLRDADNGIAETAPVEYYTLGEDRWKTACQWPPEHTRPQTFYLEGDGRLLHQKPEQTGANEYVYDPLHPARQLIDVSANEMNLPGDYAAEELRADMLCYTTPPLEQDMTISGEVACTLYFSCDAPDTDFVVRLTEVDSEGRSVKLSQGMRCARFRDSYEDPELLMPGQVYRMDIPMHKISKQIPHGNRLRFSVTSSAENLIFPNPNMAEWFAGTETRTARITVHHGGQYASAFCISVEEGCNKA